MRDMSDNDSSGGNGKAAAEQAAAHQDISRALLAGKLRPGTPLRERRLAEIFGLTRGTVRKLLLRLSAEGKVQLIPNRGAYVPQPSSKDIRQVYDARKAVESGMAMLIASRITTEQIARLKSHIREERCAGPATRDESVRLSGSFHVVLARMLGSPELEEIVQRLVARTQIFVALFEPAHHSNCAPDEHEAIVRALESGNGEGAAAVMLRHLQQVEERIMAHLDGEDTADLSKVLRAAFGRDGK